MQRVILHCDMNNFYASVECMLNPELKNKPVAVCGSVEERHGIVLAKNYAAKAFGVSTGEAIWQAKQKCQDLVIVEPVSYTHLYELVSELRSAGYQIPVLMITAKGSFDDMRQGFLSGSLKQQDNLYTLTVCGRDNRDIAYEIGSLKELI